MRNFSVTALKHRHVTLADATPHPFPGKFPTRIAYEIVLRGRDAEREVIQYSGKPSSNALQRLRKFSIQPRCNYVWMAEYDQSHMIATFQTWGWLERDIQFYPPRNIHARLWHVYHPFEPGNARLFACFAAPVFRKSIGGYSPYASVSKLKLAQVKQYKEQLKTLQFPVPAVKRKKEAR